MTDITITQTLKQDDLAKAGLYNLVIGRSPILLIIYGTLALSAIITFVNPFNAYRETENTSYNIFVYAVAIIAIPLLLWRSIKKASKKAFEKNARFYTNVSYTFTHSSYKSEGDDFSTTYKWEDLYKIKETKKWFFIHISKNQAVILDKSQIDLLQQTEMKNIFNSVQSKIKVSLIK
ncbi:YcxB family protein [Flavobacterium rakeshii]|uniref:YcxB family protein n=1 Tax=Flavobacterium rakeshii TaxID=1038845 RepID=UPI002E7B176E|nr:YcxB family protein [Flavobacterium rakeshii]MEE1899639.1 YcxB family protein [Flavobacterium rakeshii]